MGYNSANVAPPPLVSPWPGHAFHHHRSLYAQQNLPSVLASIEERLRALDALYSARFSPRLDQLAADAHARRLDSIESRIARLETLLELRLDKLTEMMSSRQLKDELAKEQMSRSVDAASERLNHRLGYMETRIDVNLAKMQSSLESLSGRVERLDAGVEAAAAMGHGGGHGGPVHPASEHITITMEGVRSGLDELRKSVLHNHHDIINVTKEEGVAVHQQLERLSSALSHMQQELNRTLTVQNDGGGGLGGAGGAGGAASEGGGGSSAPGAGGGGGGAGSLRHERHMAGNLLAAVERHASSVGSKVTNMYNELWRRTQLLEGLSKDAMALSNATRRELQEGLRSVSMQLNRFCSLQADKAGKPSFNGRENVEATVSEMNHKMGDYFQRVISTQNVLLATCHRTQENDPAFEKYLAHVLERMLDVMTSNKCQNEIEEVHQLLKSHHSTVVRNVGHNTNTILRAANSSSKESRNLTNVILENHAGLLNTTKDIQNSITNIQEEQGNVQLALEEMTATINDLQDQISTVTNSSISSDLEDDTDGIDFRKLLKKTFEDHQRHMSDEIHNLTHTIRTILHNIGSSLFSSSNKSRAELRHRPTISNTTDYKSHSNSHTIHNIHNSPNKAHSSTEAPQMFHHPEGSSAPSKLPRIYNSSSPTETDLVTSSLLPQYSNQILEQNSLLPELTINVIPEAKHDLKNNSQVYTYQTSNLKEHSTQQSVTNLKSDSNESKEKDNTFLTIVHNDKPLTTDGHVTYSSTDSTSNSSAHNDSNTLRNTDRGDEKKMDPNILGNRSHHKRHNILQIHNGQTSTEHGTGQEHEEMKFNKTSPSETTSNTRPIYTTNTTEKLPDNLREHNLNKSETSNETNIQTESTDENKSNAPHSMHHLLNKLEELSNSLMNYESTEESGDYSESKDDSEDDSLEESIEDLDLIESENISS